MDERHDIKNVKIITKHSRERKKEVEKKANSVFNKQSWAWSLIFYQRLLFGAHDFSKKDASLCVDFASLNTIATSCLRLP